MKRILFFVSAGRVRQVDRDAATAINAKTDLPVIFRNGTCGEESTEACVAVAGKVPSHYSAFPRYDNAGKLVDKGTLEQEAPATPPGELNALGLPQGSPEDRDGIKEALENAGVDFHPNSKTDKLVALYQESFLS